MPEKFIKSYILKKRKMRRKILFNSYFAGKWLKQPFPIVFDMYIANAR